MRNENVNVKAEARSPLKAQIQEMLAVITAFSNLLVKETAALKKADFKTVDALQADKKLFAKQYEAKVTAMFSRREEFAKLEMSLRETLAKERARFNEVLQQNMYALDMAQYGTQRLVDRILDAAREAVVKERETNYSQAGKAMAYKAASLSHSVDTNL